MPEVLPARSLPSHMAIAGTLMPPSVSSLFFPLNGPADPASRKTRTCKMTIICEHLFAYFPSECTVFGSIVAGEEDESVVGNV